MSHSPRRRPRPGKDRQHAGPGPVAGLSRDGRVRNRLRPPSPPTRSPSCANSSPTCRSRTSSQRSPAPGRTTPRCPTRRAYSSRRVPDEVVIVLRVWLAVGLTAGAWYFWPMWPILGGGIGVASHVIPVRFAGTGYATRVQRSTVAPPTSDGSCIRPRRLALNQSPNGLTPRPQNDRSALLAVLLAHAVATALGTGACPRWGRMAFYPCRWCRWAHWCGSR